MRPARFLLTMCACITAILTEGLALAEELSIRLSPSVTSSQLVELARVSKPLPYVTVSGESLASISGKLYGIKERLRSSLELINPTLVSEMQKSGKDFFWQELIPGTIVYVPGFSKLITNATVTVSSKEDAIDRAKVFYWDVGPKTTAAMRRVNLSLFTSTSDQREELSTTAKSAILPAVPTFHSLEIRDGKEDQARNVLANLTFKNAGIGSIVEPSFIQDVVSPCATVEDFKDNWFANRAHADKIPLASMRMSDVKIAVLDSGLDYEHDAFKSDLWDGSVAENDELNLKLPHTMGIDFTGPSPTNDIQDVSPISHGTHVSGIASGAALVSVIASLQNTEFQSKVKIMPLKVVDSTQHINLRAVKDAITFAQQFQTKIISASWNVDKDIPLQVQMLNSPGTLFVLAAGNGTKRGEVVEGVNLEEKGNEVYPPSFHIDNAITVGALAPNGEPADFSNYGNTTVQIFAPGCAIRSTVKGNKYAPETGTSQATPFVSLAAALIWAQRLDLAPILVKKRILQTADPSKASLDKSAAGNLNLAKAVSINDDVIETIDHGYSYGHVLADTIAIAGADESCNEVEPIAIRRSKLTRVYRNYAGTGKDVAVEQNGTTIEGKICPDVILFKPNSGDAHPVPISDIIDIVFKM